MERKDDVTKNLCHTNPSTSTHLIPKNTNWHTPVIVSQILTAQKLETYSMSHLLVAGFRGIEYQLLVLLSELIKLLADGKQFEAMVEASGFGNLDDVVLVVKDKGQMIAVKAFQVKYYNHPITVYDFFNQDVEFTKKAGGKNEKMHIGKFFDGWLAWKNKYPHLSCADLNSIVYSNAPLDETLRQCITEQCKFKPEFVRHAGIICIGRKEGITAEVPKNFLIKLQNVKVSSYHSSIVWTKLKEAGFLESNGKLTEKFNPEDRECDLRHLPKLPRGLSAQMVQTRLKELHNIQLQNSVDLYELLYQEAWGYLTTNGLHQKITTEQDKQSLFQQFLFSFRFQIGQEDIATLETSIQTNLAIILNHSSVGQVYLCLYYAIREWFRREYLNKQVPILTNNIINELLEDSLVRSRSVIILQGRTEATLLHVSCDCGGQTVDRDELGLLKVALSGSGLAMVVGEKGMGKSGLLKQALLDRHHTEYLVLPAVDLVEDSKLRTMLLDVVNKIEAIRIVALDGAEALLQMTDLEFKNLFSKLKSSGCVIVLTVTNEAYRDQFYEMDGEVISVWPLSLDNIRQKFPKLMRYRKMQRLMKLIQIPFYLSAITRIISQIGTEEFDYITKVRNIDLEAELIKIIMEGQDASTISIRRLTWQQVAVKMFDAPGNFSQGVAFSTISTGLSLLVNEGIVVHKNNKFRFAHDLYFEHAVMAFWLQKWEIAFIEGETKTFWKNVAKFFQNNSFVKVVFDKWLSIYKMRLSDDLIACVDTIAETNYLSSLFAMAIITHDDRLLDIFLKAYERPLEETLDAWGHFSTTYISLAIWYDNPDGLRMLIKHGVSLHHPKAGSLVLSSDSASYCQPQDEFIETDEDDSSASNDEVEEEWDAYSYTSEQSETESQHEMLQELSEDSSLNPIEQFSSGINKYWSAGFDEEPGIVNEEGEWIENPNYQDRPQYHTFYIHQTVMQNKADCLSVLLEAYREEEQSKVFQLRNKYDETPLHVGVLRNANSAVTLLLQEDIRVNITDFWGETPLHNVAYTGNLELAKLLLLSGADPNALNEVGLTPFQIVLARLDLEMVKLFMAYGADLSLSPFMEGMTVADLLEKQLERHGKSEEVEFFVLQLIELLNYGWNEGGFKWATECSEVAPKLYQAQLSQVGDLMTLVEHRAQLSECGPGFDYWDQESELEYAIENADVEKLEELQDYILEDLDQIGYVLDAEQFSFLKEEILEQWFNTATESQYENLKQYAEESNDKDVLKYIEVEMAFLEFDDNIDDPSGSASRAIFTNHSSSLGMPQLNDDWKEKPKMKEQNYVPDSSSSPPLIFIKSTVPLQAVAQPPIITYKICTQKGAEVQVESLRGGREERPVRPNEPTSPR